MTKLIAVLFLTIISLAHAATITFTGVVDQSSQFAVGDTFTATFMFNQQTGRVQRYVIAVGIDFELRGTKGGGLVALDNNPARGSVYYQIVQSDFAEITLQAATPNGVIPPIEQFNLNDFIFRSSQSQQTFGHLTSLPTIRGLK